MRFIGNLLRIYSYIFEAVLCAMAVVFGVLVLLSSGTSTVNVGWLPWSDHSLPAWLIGLGLLGLLCTALAALGRVRLLLFLFAIAALVILVKGLFMSSWTFHGADEAKRALYLVIAAFVAVVGAVPLGSLGGSGSPSSRARI